MSSPTITNSSFSNTFADENYVHPVLIVGAGPAGSLLAFCLARLGVQPLIVDSRNAVDHEWGRGDALLCRTVEMFKTLGLADTIAANGVGMWKRAFWNTSVDPPVCTTIADQFPADLDTDSPYAVNTRQGLVERIILEGAEKISGVQVLRPWSVTDTEMVDDPNADAVIVTLKSQYGETRKVKARRVVGCDGGRSTVRRSLKKYDVQLEGESHDSIWSAIDVVGFETDFPDVNMLAIIASKHGSIRFIPREDINGQNCIRIYCELNSEEKSSLEDVTAKIQRVLHPFKFTWEAVNWFTVYTVAQRIASAFDVNQRIFLAGDAAHIHSPKAGLGMNTSFLDAHNLALKIALVENGVAKPSVLSTYALERRGVADQLMKMDGELIRVYAAHGKSSDPADQQKLIAFQRANAPFQAGTGITYAPNVLVDDTPALTPTPMLALVGGQGLCAGRRILPATVRRYSDGIIVKMLDDAIPFDGRFTIFLCLGDVIQLGAVEKLEALREAMFRANGLHDKAGKIIRFVGVTTASHLSIALSSLFHQRLRLLPGGDAAESRILFNSSKVYTDDVPCLSPYLSHACPRSLPSESTPAPTDILSTKAAAGILVHPLHQKWDIDPKEGGIVVVRPDGHVGVLRRGLDVQMAWSAVEKYFDGFLKGRD
ncbi:FAD binding domain-containing protein [Roridomyces roridus]|uniref:FAD binding domain-containing protein n=1 Tax=Roridomyces roridus TaxID=1738132 RepID=A0AAD7FYV8_9AGAR|nr:FAD binding domain-containing protein [Roridomyces roridus]